MARQRLRGEGRSNSEVSLGSLYFNALSCALTPVENDPRIRRQSKQEGKHSPVPLAQVIRYAQSPQLHRRCESELPALPVNLFPPQPIILVVSYLQPGRQRLHKAWLRIRCKLGQQARIAVQPQRGRRGKLSPPFPEMTVTTSRADQ